MQSIASRMFEAAALQAGVEHALVEGAIENYQLNRFARKVFQKFSFCLLNDCVSVHLRLGLNLDNSSRITLVNLS